MKPSSAMRALLTRIQVVINSFHRLLLMVIGFTLPDLFRVILCVELNSDVLVSGAKHRNRAVHGDMVVVELLPRNEWKGRTTALTEGQGEERSMEDTQSQPMPTGT